MKKVCVIFVFFTSCLAGLAPAVFSEPSFQASLGCEKIFLDQACELKIQFEWPKEEGQYLFQVPNPEVQNLRIERRGESQEIHIKEGIERTQKTFLFEFQPLQAGRAAVKEFQIQYLDLVSNKQGKFVVPQSSFEVRRRGRAERLWGAVLAAFLLTFTTALLLRVRLKQREKSLTPVEAPSTLEQLQGLQQKIKPGTNPKELSYELSKEFRTFLLSHYQLSPAANTEDELTEEIQRKVLPREEEREITALLSELRQVKFISKELAGRDFERLAAGIVEFVKKRQVIAGSNVAT